VIVVDASVVVEVLLRSDAGIELEERLFDGDDPLHAPHMLDIEVANALRRCTLRGDLDQRQGRDALADLAAMAIERHGHQPLLERIWQLRHNLTAYDAAYLALAERLDAPLLTCDAGLASLAGHRARIELA
jgi:predicted nucleic acid-binding protein